MESSIRKNGETALARTGPAAYDDTKDRRHGRKGGSTWLTAKRHGISL